MEFELRDVREDDFEWLYDLRVQTMSKYIVDSGDSFSKERQAVRIRQDFESIKIVSAQNQDIGMFKVVRNTNAWKIVQIQLLPQYQRIGIGSQLIRSLLKEATITNVPVYLSVLKVNPAKSLYEKLGFGIVEEKEKSYTMRYSI